MKTVSTLISIYKEPIEWIERSLLSILNQDRAIEFSQEIVVILDNPEYESDVKNLISILMENNLKEGDSIIFEVNENNIGLALSLNKALENSSGDYIARLDADDVNVVDRYVKQLSYMEDNPSVDLCGSGIYRVDENFNLIGEATNPSDFLLLKKQIQCKSIAYHPTWFAKKEIFKSLNGYNKLPAAQDLDFILRAVSAGFVISNHEESLVYYRINTGSISVKKSLLQRKCCRYLITKYNNGTMGTPINEIDLNKFIDYSLFENKLHSISQSILINKSRFSGHLKILYMLLAVPLSLLLSKEQSYHLFKLFMFKLKSRLSKLY